MSTAAPRQTAPLSPALGFGSSNDDLELYSSLDELQRRTLLLERELRSGTAGAETFSGRIIHAMYLLPFHIQPREEVEWLFQFEDADFPHAADLSSQQIRRAVRQAAARAGDGRADRNDALAAQAAKVRTTSFWEAENERNPRLAEMRSEMLDAVDFDEELVRNQLRSRDTQGRRAWMEEALSSSDSEPDRFLPADSSHGVGEDSRTPDTSWRLVMRQGHAAMMSGIHSLSKSYSQTIVAYPGHVTFATHSQGDERTHSSQTSPEERREIEEALRQVDDPKVWGSHFGDQSTHGIRQVPVWLDHNTARGHYDGYCKSSA